MSDTSESIAEELLAETSLSFEFGAGGFFTMAAQRSTSVLM